MKQENILIIGSNGQLGTALKLQYPGARAVDYQELDITNTKQLAEYDWSNITHIINAAAYTNVDGAETPEGRVAAWKINAVGVANLVKTATENNITLVHISSDYVYDGTQSLHNENEPYSPLSVYGASKAAGDICTQTHVKHYILRTSWVIGEGKNFDRTMIELAEKNISPTVVSDQIGRLTFTKELVRAIDHLLTTNQPFGTYNVTNEGETVSWAQITRQIFKLLGRDDLTVTDITTKDYFAGKDGIAPRPLQSSLDLTKIQSTGFKSSDWKIELEEYIKGESS